MKQYWHFDQFRPNQLEIIEAIIAQQDVLALLPTGGGKSVCYQVPGLVMDGLCLVISPLIALMEDQINQLKAKNINAVAINSSMNKKQIDIALDNAIYGNTKFLYVSPERLNTHLFKVRFAKMKINLIAIDEAHCISEWGYDFRPSYQNIAQLRKIQPNVPFLGLTATATENVVDDIQDKLEFATKRVIRQSFERKNLIYNTWLTNNKLNRIETFLKGNSGSGIIYCSTRRKVKTLYLKLIESGFSVDYYHAGLAMDERRAKQKRWTNNQVKVIIATNAFGMGIDKPDVRFVLHHDIPMSLEAYFQEAGRGGRDGQSASGHLFYETQDIHDLRKSVSQKYPPIETIKRIYNALGNHFQLAFGAGQGERFSIDLGAFSEKYNQSLIVVYNALKFLELCEFIELSDNYKQPSRLRILGNNHDLYNYQVKDKVLNQVIQFLIRTEMGIFEDYVKINEQKISKKTGLTISKISEKLNYLQQLELIDYIPRSNLPTVTYTAERLTDNNLSISPKFYADRKKVALTKLEAMIDFLTTETCKSEALLHYFNEVETEACGYCSSCSNEKTTGLTALRKIIKQAAVDLKNDSNEVHLSDLIARLKEHQQAEILENLRWMADHNEISMDSLGKSFKFNS